MTLIVGFAQHFVPILVGDLLISAPENGQPPVHLPMLGFSDQIFPPGSGYVVHSLRQKLALVADNCAVAWAGDELAARYIVKALRSKAQTEVLNYESIVALMAETKPDLGSLSASIIGWVSDPGGHQIFRFGDTLRFMTPLFRGVYVAGTGKETLQNFANQQPIDLRAARGTATAYAVALSKAHAAVAALLQAEVRNASPILHYFGGGYEIALHDGARFVKFGDTTYVFCFAEVQIDRDLLILNPRVYIIGQHYENDLLLVRSSALEFEADDWSHLRTLDASVHVVPPVYRDETDDEVQGLSVPSFSTRHICYAVLIRLSDGSWITKVSFERNSDGESPTLILREEDGRLTFGFKPEFINGLREGLNEHILGKKRPKRRRRRGARKK